MVNNKFFLACFATLAMTLLASCSEDDATNEQPASGGINFELTLAPQTRVSTGADFKCEWEDGDQVGLFAVKRSPGAPGGMQAYGNEIHNIRLRYSNGTWSGVPTWPAGEDYVMDFYAYYPYDDTQTDPTVHFFGGLLNQTDPRYHNDSDILMAENNNSGAGYANGSTVSLQFEHKMAMVQITIDDTYGAIDTSDEPTATLHSLNTAFRFNWTTGAAAAPEAATDITMHRFPTTDGSLVFRAYLPAQTIAAGATLFSLTLGGATLEAAPLAAELTLQAGRAELFTQQIPQAVALAVMKPQPQANSYMVAPGKGILIPISQANRVLTEDGLGATTTGLNEVTTDNYTVELVWGDQPIRAGGVITALSTCTRDGKGYLLVTAGDTRGNAVIGIKINGENTYRWSWHIWVTDEVTSATDAATGLTWMDRNLGAAGTTYNSSGKNGLFYQWGRKDAFPGSNGSNTIQNYYTQAGGNTSTNANPTAEYTDLPDMVRNPLTFATNYETYYGSLNVSGNTNNSWGGVSGEKTLYDPCPAGWKIPASGNWGSETDWGAQSNSGRLFKSSSVNHYYPATGYRSVNGSLPNVGSYGHYWSDTGSSTAGGYNLYFGSTGVHPNNSTNRGAGFAARCVEE